MKNLKRILAIVLALVMVMGTMVTTAFANTTPETDGSITINAATGETLDGRTFAIYKVFDAQVGVSLDPSNPNNVIYSWNNAVKDENGVNKYYTFLESYFALGKTESDISLYVSAVRGLDTAAKVISFGEQMYKHIKGTGANPNIMPTDTKAASGSSVTFDGLAYGYYLVYETTNLDDVGMTAQMRSSIILTNVDPASSVVIKASNPDIIKTVTKVTRDASTMASVSIGDKFTYTLTVKVPDLTAFITETDGDNPATEDVLEGNPFIFKITDIWDAGITPDGSTFKVTYGSGTTATGSSNSVYTVQNKSVDGKDGYEIIFKYAWLKSLPANSTFTITYDAVLNSKATVHDNAANPVAVPNKNAARLEYSRNAIDYSKTASKTTTASVYTYELIVNKVDSINNPLTGASFRLGRENEWAIFDENLKIVGWTTTEEATGTEITMTDSKFTVKGLGAGSYFLKETDEPSGYQLPSDVIKFEIDEVFGVNALTDMLITSNNSLVVSVGHEGDAGIVEMTIKNNPVGALPETGGMGTTMFIFGGIALMAGAAAFLVLRKREAKN